MRQAFEKDIKKNFTEKLDLSNGERQKKKSSRESGGWMGGL